jgi:hypothetical protein
LGGEKLNEEAKALTADELVERWARRSVGGSLASPGGALGWGGEPGPDDYWAAVSYVESTKGFGEARPVLSHVYIHGRPLGEFRIAMPGEPRFTAFQRLRWMSYWTETDPDVPRRVLRSFAKRLVDRCREQPFRLPPRVDRCDELVAASSRAGAMASQGVVTW